jgi:ubiquinone/menaquinone biosynthesis C-methylase UbiE
MGLYRDHVYPRVMEWTLGRAALDAERAAALADARGDVLEIGFGSGLNLAHYPPAVRRLSVVDPSDALAPRVAARIAAAPFPVERRLTAAERLPFADATFDCVTSTWTLCTIPDVRAALAEVRRVLKPSGTLLFLEHGRSDDARVARWQDRVNPIQRVIGCGCNLNRRIADLVADGGFTITRLERYVLAGEPRLYAEMYRGAARARP